MSGGLPRILATATAIAAWSGLAIQYVLLFETMGGPLAAAWRFLGYFTLLTNTLVALIATRAALDPDARNGLNGARVEYAAAISIVIVGLVYSLLLRGTWQPEGWQAVADHALHDASPVLFFVFWLLRARERLAWRDAVWALVWPVLYLGYALARGAIDGWYAYWFLDPATQSIGELAQSVGMLAVGAAFLALGMIALNRLIARRRSHAGPTSIF